MRVEAWTATPEKDEIGWVIAPSRWGAGYATEAAQSAIRDGFERVGLDRIVSFTLPENVASWRVMERCGMHRRGEAEWAGRMHIWYDATPSVRPSDR